MTNKIKSIQWNIPGQFSKDPNYLFRYYGTYTLIVALMVCVTVIFNLSLPTPENPVVIFLLILFSIYVGGLSSVFIHNANHKSFRPLWLNRFAGELAGFHQLYG